MYREPSKIEKIFDFVEYNWKIFKRLFKFMAICFILLFGYKWGVAGYKRFTELRQTYIIVNQITSLVGNARTIAIQDPKGDLKELLIKSGALPSKMVEDGKLRNIFGGAIEIAYSGKLDTVNPLVKIPTFKLSYRGLSKGVCKRLATLDWSKGQTGLVSAAVGKIDADGKDTAWEDIEEDYEKDSRSVIIDEKGRAHIVHKIPYQLVTVAKPDDIFMQLPFPEDFAESGCLCGTKNECSFALRYAVYNTEE